MYIIVDCTWSEWQRGECSSSCGGGKRRNKRMKLVEERDGGICKGDPISEEECNKDVYCEVVARHMRNKRYFISNYIILIIFLS